MAGALSGLPHFKGGMQLSDMHAQEMNRLVQLVGQHESRILKTEQEVKRTDVEAPTRTVASVVVTKNPVASDKNLKVRRVRYQTNPPQPCTEANNETTCHIVWDGPEFDAYPDFGRKVTEYSDAFWNGDDDGFDDTTKFLQARRIDVQQWVVELPESGGNSIAFARVIGVQSVSPPTLNVRKIKETSPGVFADDGGTIFAKPHPKYDPAWYSEFERYNVLANSDTLIAAIVQVGGVWWVLGMLLPWHTIVPSTSLPVGDCAVT